MTSELVRKVMLSIKFVKVESLVTDTFTPELFGNDSQIAPSIWIMMIISKNSFRLALYSWGL